MPEPVNTQLSSAELTAGLQTALPAYVRAQRWFGGKGRSMTGMRLDDHVWLGGGPEADCLAVVDVTYADGDPDRYALWLGVRRTAGDLPLVAQLPGGPAIVDVSTHPPSAARLLQHLARGRALPSERGGALRVADVEGDTQLALSPDVPIQPLSADQSNTSLRAGPFLFKLFRRLQAGESPELEFGRFLTSRTSFRDFPALRGSVSHVTAEGVETPLGVLQTFVPNDGDGWRYVQGQLARHAEGGHPWSSMHADLFTLGAKTAAFHHASASDPTVAAFAPEPVTEARVHEWTSAVSESARRAVSHLPHAALDAAEHARLSEALASVARWDRALAPDPGAASGSFSLIRVHGDYHLGQTLRTRDGFVIIDFEGEPARSLEERRRKHCALKDVAGMLRSFEYALAVAADNSRERAALLRGTLPLAEAFLDGYMETAGDAVFLPRGADLRRSWVRFFEVEKALYELEYEINNRPDWAPIPALGLLRLLDD